MRTLLVATCLVAASAAGCKNEEMATFQGKVTNKGKPITSGVIYFLGPKMQQGQGVISPDGTYTATDVPLGDVKVSFQAKGVEAPYDDGNTTTLIYSITPSVKNLDINVP